MTYMVWWMLCTLANWSALKFNSLKMWVMEKLWNCVSLSVFSFTLAWCWMLDVFMEPFSHSIMILESLNISKFQIPNFEANARRGLAASKSVVVSGLTHTNFERELVPVCKENPLSCTIDTSIFLCNSTLGGLGGFRVMCCLLLASSL